MDKVAVFQIEKKKLRQNNFYGSNPVSANQYIRTSIFFIYLYAVYYKATTFLQDTFTYFNYFFADENFLFDFYFRIPCGFSVFSFK